jgi:cytochrome P450 family 135
MTQLAAEPTETIRSATTLPPGPRCPGPVQTVRYTFAQPSFFAASRARYGLTWTMRLPNFPRFVVTRDRDAIRRFHGQAVRSYTYRIRQLITTELETWTPGRVIASQPPARAVTLEIIVELVLGVGDPELQAERAAIFDSFNTPLKKEAHHGTRLDRRNRGRTGPPARRT